MRQHFVNYELLFGQFGGGNEAIFSFEVETRNLRGRTIVNEIR